MGGARKRRRHWPVTCLQVVQHHIKLNVIGIYLGTYYLLPVHMGAPSGR